MAKILIVDPTLYLRGQVTLYRGDQWVIPAQIVDDFNGVNVPTDLTAASGATAFFPATASNLPNISVPVAVTDAAKGFVQVVVPTAVTPNVGLLQDPTSWFVQVQLVSGLQTVFTPDQPLTILDPAFLS